MSKVIHGVDAPLGSRSVVGKTVDPVDNGISHVEVTGCEVDLCTKCHGTVLELAVPHSFEQIKALLDRSVAEGALSGSIDIASHLLHLLGCELADICKALLYEFYGKTVHLLEVFGCVEESVAPVVTEPLDVFLDSIYILFVFLSGIRVIHTKVTKTTVELCSTEVDLVCLGVTYVKVAVRLGRETGMHLLAVASAAFL